MLSLDQLHLIRCIALGLCFLGASAAVFADEDTMTPTAKIAQNIQCKIHPFVQIPLSYNYNQNRQPDQNMNGILGNQTLMSPDSSACLTSAAVR